MLAIVAAMILPQGFARSGQRRTASERLAGMASGRRRSVADRVFARRCRCSPPENEANPWKLIAAVPPELRSQPVLNGYSMGGPLILSGIRPYIDGRGDMYGDELVLGYSRIAQGDARRIRRGGAALEHPLGDRPERQQAADRACSIGRRAGGGSPATKSASIYARATSR